MEPTLPRGLVWRHNNGKFNFSAAGGKAYFYYYLWCNSELQDGGGRWWQLGHSCRVRLELPPGHFQWSSGQGQLLKLPQLSSYPKNSFIRQCRVEKSWHKWAMGKTGQFYQSQGWRQEPLGRFWLLFKNNDALDSQKNGLKALKKILTEKKYHCLQRQIIFEATVLF